jgi:hypothetical protein
MHFAGEDGLYPWMFEAKAEIASCCDYSSVVSELGSNYGKEEDWDFVVFVLETVIGNAIVQISENNMKQQENATEIAIEND